MVKSPPFHGGVAGSTPAGSASPKILNILDRAIVERRETGGKSTLACGQRKMAGLRVQTYTGVSLASCDGRQRPQHDSSDDA